MIVKADGMRAHLRRTCKNNNKHLQVYGIHSKYVLKKKKLAGIVSIDFALIPGKFNIIKHKII